jgi:small-conductance mechanosensitive channel
MEHVDWERIVTAAVVIGVTLVAARLIDRRMVRRELAPEAVTRYQVLRRSVTAAIVAVGILSALLVIPQIRAVAGAILASGAVIGLVVGFAAQKTLGNFIAGLLIAFTQPLRIGDLVEVDDSEGVVEEIGLTYTFIRLRDDVRLVIPNEKLASDTIKNASIVSREKLAQVTLNVPLDKDLSAAVDALRPLVEEAPRGAVLVSDLGPDKAVVTVRASADDPRAVERLESDLRLQAHERLRAAGVLR